MHILRSIRGVSVQSPLGSFKSCTMKLNKKIMIVAGIIILAILIPWRAIARRETKTVIRNGKWQQRPERSRSLKNNNPGNIKISNNNWVGKVPVNQNSDGVFEQFVEKKFGTRAMVKNIQTYIRRDGIDTVEGIINRWAPNSENPTSQYVTYVVTQSGLRRNFPVRVDDKETFKLLMMAMADFEAEPSDRPALTSSEFNQGWAEV